jgi:hypothetical protein
MTRVEAIAKYSALSPTQQIAVLAHFGHELTVAARDTYVPGTDDVSDAPRLRHANEMLHRVLAHIWHLSEGRAERYPDEVLISMFWEEWALFQPWSREALERVLHTHDS